MKEGPDISQIAALIGDPARANILTALMAGQALTATELALQAGVTPQTASSHLSKLQLGGLVLMRKQGRHRYFSLSGDDVGAVLENLMQFAASRGLTRVRTGPKDPALRAARVCYNHLAGDMGVTMFDSLAARKLIGIDEDAVRLTEQGRIFVSDLGIELDSLEKIKRPLCRSCLDWSVRRSHLAGTLGTALLDMFYANNWAKREQELRVVTFSRNGRERFNVAFPVS